MCSELNGRIGLYSRQPKREFESLQNTLGQITLKAAALEVFLPFPPLM